ncbi:MAG: DUF502 domain-containing protein [Verrucomicrobiae bacterium]|nr:DUF502 domain-containing protein [Verrucomicrobiae bacterium]
MPAPLPTPPAADSTPPEAADAHPRRSIRGHFFAFLGNRFFAGLAVAIPVIVTAWMLVLSYRFILYVGRPVIEAVVHGINLALHRTEDAGNLIVAPEWLLNVFGILTPAILFFALGIMATNVLGAKIISLFERLFSKFPVISVIYSGLKQVMDSFRNFGSGRNFKRVAYVAYPAPGCRLIGFVTGQYRDEQIGKDVTSIFIPTSPNPMTGFVIVAENEHVFESSLTIEQATKVILSAGLVAPDFHPSKASANPPEAASDSDSEEERAANEALDAATARAEEQTAESDRRTEVQTLTLPDDSKFETSTSEENEDENSLSLPPFRYAFGKAGADPVVRHDAPATAPAANTFDGLTGYEGDEY